MDRLWLANLARQPSYFPFLVQSNKVDVLQLIGKWGEAEAILEASIDWASDGGHATFLADCKCSLGLLLLNKGELERSLSLTEEARDLYAALGDQRGVGKAVGIIGVYHMTTGEYTRAMECYQRQLQLSEATGDTKGTSIAVGNISAVHYYQGDYPRAMECFERQLRLCEESGDRVGMTKAIGNMGLVYCEKEDYQRAQERYGRQLQICEELGDKVGISKAIGNMGNVYHETGDWRRAMECFGQKLRICEELGDKKGIALAVSNMGIVHKDQGETGQAMQCLERALRISEALGDKRGISQAVQNMGDVHFEQGDYRRVIECYDRAIALARELGIKYQLCEYLDKKAKSLFLLSGRSPAAPNWLQAARDLNREALQIAGDVGRLDVIFNGEVLRAQLAGLSSREDGANALAAMLRERTERGEHGPTADSRIATLHYELWRMLIAPSAAIPDRGRENATADDHCRQALALYRQLAETAPKPEYQRLIAELSQPRNHTLNT